MCREKQRLLDEYTAKATVYGQSMDALAKNVPGLTARERFRLRASVEEAQADMGSARPLRSCGGAPVLKE
jgi:hypothetical protein